MSANQIEAEREAVLSFDVEEALKAGTKDLVIMTAYFNVEVNSVPNVKKMEIRPPKLTEITDIWAVSQQFQGHPIEVLKRWNIIDQQEFYASYFNATDNQSSIMVQKVVTKTPNLNIFSSGSLKTYRWTLSIVPVFANWIEAEREAALSVDAEEAAKACAPDLVKMTVPSFGVVNGDEKSVPTGKEREIRLSKLNEILDIREFRHCVSSTDFLFLP
ncbi:hypothetical protein Aperf_G00000118837 [Anoplocephala perfoliata]